MKAAAAYLYFFVGLFLSTATALADDRRPSDLPYGINLGDTLEEVETKFARLTKQTATFPIVTWLLPDRWVGFFDRNLPEHASEFSKMEKRAMFDHVYENVFRPNFGMESAIYRGERWNPEIRDREDFRGEFIDGRLAMGEISREVPVPFKEIDVYAEARERYPYLVEKPGGDPNVKNITVVERFFDGGPELGEFFPFYHPGFESSFELRGDGAEGTEYTKGFGKYIMAMLSHNDGVILSIVQRATFSCRQEIVNGDFRKQYFGGGLAWCIGMPASEAVLNGLRMEVEKAKRSQ